jgi:hypothetical protein
VILLLALLWGSAGDERGAYLEALARIDVRRARVAGDRGLLEELRAGLDAGRPDEAARLRDEQSLLDWEERLVRAERELVAEERTLRGARERLLGAPPRRGSPFAEAELGELRPVLERLGRTAIALDQDLERLERAVIAIAARLVDGEGRAPPEPRAEDPAKRAAEAAGRVDEELRDEETRRDREVELARVARLVVERDETGLHGRREELDRRLPAVQAPGPAGASFRSVALRVSELRRDLDVLGANEALLDEEIAWLRRLVPALERERRARSERDAFRERKRERLVEAGAPAGPVAADGALEGLVRRHAEASEALARKEDRDASRARFGECASAWEEAKRRFDEAAKEPDPPAAAAEPVGGPASAREAARHAARARELRLQSRRQWKEVAGWAAGSPRAVEARGEAERLDREAAAAESAAEELRLKARLDEGDAARERLAELEASRGAVRWLRLPEVPRVAVGAAAAALLLAGVLGFVRSGRRARARRGAALLCALVSGVGLAGLAGLAAERLGPAAAVPGVVVGLLLARPLRDLAAFWRLAGRERLRPGDRLRVRGRYAVLEALGPFRVALAPEEEGDAPLPDRPGTLLREGFRKVPPPPEVVLCEAAWLIPIDSEWMIARERALESARRSVHEAWHALRNGAATPAGPDVTLRVEGEEVRLTVRYLAPEPLAADLARRVPAGVEEALRASGIRDARKMY